MLDSVILDEIELQLINSLQLNARAPWTLIGNVIGIDPATAARRWERLSAEGLAWISVYPGAPWLWDAVCASVGVRCGGHAGAVAEVLCADRRVATIEHVTGGGDLLLTVFVRDLAALSSYVLGTLGAIPGVRDCRTTVVTAFHTEGSRWRLRTLNTDQLQRLSSTLPTAEPRPSGPLSAVDQALFAALEFDARAGYAELGAQVGISTSTARRRLSTLLGTGRFVMRCEIAQQASGWPVSATLWCRVPPADLERVAKHLAQLPETRLCSTVTGGRANLQLAVWLRSAADIHRLEASLTDKVPGLELLDVTLALRHVKRMGRLLDSRGCAVGAVPLGVD
ncbi:Lrp/AsnC family transcriptional regulator [Nocardia sp. CA-135398]|uniref:Lrp/AsnC family transcriptional regulator n=1 Tax=Nocardia sp. CA-135398 TaxID=3239977 RepID=UPI003D97C7A3